MDPIHFSQANDSYGPPKGMGEEHCRRVPVFKHTVKGGAWDGSLQVVTAWQPTAEDIERIKNGAPIFFSCLGGLPPHYLTTVFDEAIRPG